ncbi:hypothetical protein K439DRAFT_1630460 [Ramaria rubella]|nr:hypothetical protein K439DRAFT_1630460 [Ramaria rubella]
MNDMSGLLALYNLLSQASTLPCSDGTRAFLSLLTSEDDRFSVAIDGFIPTLQNQNIQIPQRILAAYVLNALNASHNCPHPFHDQLLNIFESERNFAIATSSVKQSLVGSSCLLNEGGKMQVENEQLVWVLWKILNRESDDLATYSPDILSRITIPEHLKPAQLVVHAGSGHDNDIHSNSLYPSRTDFASPLNSIRPTCRPPKNFAPVSQTAYSSLTPPSIHTSAYFARNITSFSSAFSPFDDISSDPRSSLFSNTSKRRPNEARSSMQDDSIPNRVLGAQCRYPPSPELPGIAHEGTHSTASSVSTHSGRFDFVRDAAGSPHQLRVATEDQRQQTLLRALYEQLHPQSERWYSQGSVSITDNRLSPNMDTRASPREPSWAERQARLPILTGLGTSAQLDTPQCLQNHHCSNYGTTLTHARFSPSIQPHTLADVKLRPISIPSSPHKVPPNCITASLALAPSVTCRTASNKGGASGQEAHLGGILQHETQVQLNGISQQSHKLPFPHLKIKSDSSVSQSTRSPGVIGSGRPSAPAPKSNVSAENQAVGSRWSHIVGNGRLSFPAAVINDTPKVQPHAMIENKDVMSFSALPLRNAGEETKYKTDLLGQVMKLSPGGTVQLQVPAGQTNDALFGPTTRTSDSMRLRSQDIADLKIPPSPRSASQSQPFLQPSFQDFPTSHLPLVVDSELKNEATLVSSPHAFSTLPSSSSLSARYTQLKPYTNHSPPGLPSGGTRHESTLEEQINEKDRDALSRAVLLFLNARERVLTLSEQRTLQPYLHMLTEPVSLLPPEDLPSLVAKNPDVAAKLLVHLLNRKDENAVNIERVLSGMNQADLSRLNSGPQKASISRDTMDAIQAMVNFVSSCGVTSYASAPNEVSTFGGREAQESYLNALRSLPPTTQSFNVIAKLLRPTAVPSSQREESPEFEVAKLIRIEVLGGFVSGSVQWIEQAEQEEKKGDVHDDRVAVATSSLCRFYSSLLKHRFVSAASEADTTEIMTFALQFSRFEEARSLYSTLAAARA